MGRAPGFVCDLFDLMLRLEHVAEPARRKREEAHTLKREEAPDCERMPIGSPHGPEKGPQQEQLRGLLEV